MIMNREQAEQLTNDTLIADLLIRVKSLENMLIRKNIISGTELQEEMSGILDVLTMSILEKSQVSGNLNEIVEGLKK